MRFGKIRPTTGSGGNSLQSRLGRFKSQALARPDVRQAYDDVADEFVCLDEVLKARLDARRRRKKVG
jgi:hypothetical protein